MARCLCLSFASVRPWYLEVICCIYWCSIWLCAGIIPWRGTYLTRSFSPFVICRSLVARLQMLIHVPKIFRAISNCNYETPSVSLSWALPTSLTKTGLLQNYTTDVGPLPHIAAILFHSTKIAVCVGKKFF